MPRIRLQLIADDGRVLVDETSNAEQTLCINLPRALRCEESLTMSLIQYSSHNCSMAELEKLKKAYAESFEPLMAMSKEADNCSMAELEKLKKAYAESFEPLMAMSKEADHGDSEVGRTAAGAAAGADGSREGQSS